MIDFKSEYHRAKVHDTFQRYNFLWSKMADSYSWTLTSPMASYGSCYGPLTTTNHSAQSFYAAAASRCMANCPCVADDRLPVNSSRDHYYSALPGQQQQQLGWFSVRNMLIPLNVETTTTAMPTPTTTYLPSHGDDDVAGMYLSHSAKVAFTE